MAVAISTSVQDLLNRNHLNLDVPSSLLRKCG